MLFFTRWKAAAILLTALVVCLCALPNFFSDSVIRHWPSWAQCHIVLGLDLQGGSHLLLEVDSAAVRKEQLQAINDDVLRVLRQTRVPFTGRAIRGNSVEVHITRDADIDSAANALAFAALALGLNIVVGWNEGEFDMFGVEQRAHQARYEYAQEWIDVIKMIWSDRDDFDFHGQYLIMKGIRGKPKPYGATRPVIMNAGASPTGQAFAVKNCDAFFLQASRTSLEESAVRVRRAKDDARVQGLEIGCYTVGVVTCRPTKKEAEDYFRHCIVERADWSAVDGILALKNISPQTVPMQEYLTQRSQYAQGMGGLPIIGDPDHVAAQIADLSKAGLTGIAISLVNYLDELPYFVDEVIGRLERMGLREKARS